MFQTRKGILSIAGVALTAAAALSLSHSQAAPAKKPLGQPVAPQFKSGEVLVKFKKAKGLGTFGAQAHALMDKLGRRYALSYTPLITDKSIFKITVRGDADMGTLLSDVAQSANVEYAEPNFVYHTYDLIDDPVKAVLPNDPALNLTWGLLNTGQKDSKGQEGIPGVDIGATKAWATGTGSKDIVVAVIDTGVDYNHPDLKNNIFVNTKEQDNGKDNDGNGFVADIHGWNFEGKNNNPMDDNRHGSHCSGTIGAEGDNGVGVAGVNWHVSILPVKFLSAGGSGSLDDAVESINYATLMGAKIMSNSWGGGGYSQAMFDAIKKAKEKGILFVAAAGNDGNNNDTTASYPASYELDNVIAVAATDNRDVKASWSNYGRSKVHLAAPGVNIYSTTPTSKNNYDTLSGTSMACPHVSGAAALLWSLNKDMSYADIKKRLTDTVDPVHNLSRKVAAGGRLNVYNAINNIVPERHEPAADRWKAFAQSIDSEHPYKSNTSKTFEISHPGAKFIRVHFTKISTEAGYDTVTLKDAKGQVIETLSGEQSDYTTDYVEGDKATVSFKSDTSVDGWGFAIDHYDFID